MASIVHPCIKPLKVSSYSGLSGGTILYTALCQLLRDRRVEVAACLQLMAAILGFAAIMAIQILGRLWWLGGV